MNHNKRELIQELLEKNQQKYNEILLNYSNESINKALVILREKRRRTMLLMQNQKQNILDKETNEIFELMSNYEQDIKNIFIKNGQSITHITDISPEKMKSGRILRSKNRTNHYETERGEWAFASSNPMNGKNPYIARNSKDGMILIGKNAYIYGGNNMEVKQNEQGQKKVVLKIPNYVYEINPAKFRPVVILREDENLKPIFEFSEEWISDEDVDINDPTQILGVKIITDITDLIKHYQVFCDVNKTGEALKIRKISRKEDAINIIVEDIKNKKLRYINGEANINVNQKLKTILERDVKEER